VQSILAAIEDTVAQREECFALTVFGANETKATA
jgi:hypothetical protein